MGQNHSKKFLSAFSVTAIAMILLFAAGCGDNSKVTPTPASPTATQLRIGDAPVDTIIDFEVTIGSPIIVTPSGAGNPLSITVGPNRLELSHMAGKMEPLSILNVPQGTYGSAQITIQNPEMTFLSSTGTRVEIEGNASQAVTVTFNPPVTIGPSATVLNVDLNVANSITTDASGTPTGFNFTSSSFTFSQSAVAAQDHQEDDNGEMEDVTGLVSSISGSNFVLNVGQSGAQLTFATDNTTEFENGLTNLAGALNKVVEVEGFTRADGTLFAKEIEAEEAETDAEVEGLITDISGTTLTLIAQDGMGPGMDATKVGATFTVSVSGLAAGKYKIDLGKCDTNGLNMANFPFGPDTIQAGQRIEVEAVGSIPVANSPITAAEIELEQQAMNGTVSNLSPVSNGAATFDLTVAPESYLAVLSGQTTVHVFQQPGTDNRFGTIANGSLMRVRGLLFWTGTTFNMIARRITAP